MDRLTHFISEISWWLSLVGFINILVLLLCCHFLDRTKQVVSNFLSAPIYFICGYFIFGLCFGSQIPLLTSNLVIFLVIVTSALFFSTYWIAFERIKTFIKQPSLLQTQDVIINNSQSTEKVANNHNILSDEELLFLQQIIPSSLEN